MYIDTDSLFYRFNVPDIYDYIKRDLTRFDTNDYPSDNIHGITLVNKKVLGMMKYENNGKIMTEFVELRANLYAYKIQGEDKYKKKAKGIRGSALRSINFDDYKQCLFERENLFKDQHLIQSRKHKFHTILQRKLALSWLDNKRILFNNTSDTVPYGYKK